LVIDAEATTGDVIALVLSGKYRDRTQVVKSRHAGWVVLEEEPPDVVFIYLRADGVNAADFCRQLRSSPKVKHVPVIVFGAVPPKYICAELREAGATGYLYEPFGPKDILAARDTALRGETYYA
jgi:DNA-binding response OmpR family regulator